MLQLWLDRDMKLKVWEGKLAAEPDDWFLEGVDPEPRVTGNSTIFALMGLATGEEMFIDNVTLRNPNATAVNERIAENIPAQFQLHPNQRPI